MGRHTGPVEKLSRREGVELYLKGERALLGGDLLGVHAGEIIIVGVERADMIEAQPAPLARSIGDGAGAIHRRAELARLGAAGRRARR